MLSLFEKESTELVFRKTGNFWVDNGIVNLYQILSEMLRQNEFDFERPNLSTGELTLQCNPDELETILDRAKEILIGRYTSETKNYGWYYDGKLTIDRKRHWTLGTQYFYGHLTGRPSDKIFVKDLDEDLKARIDDFLDEHSDQELKYYGQKKKYVPTSVMHHNISTSYNFEKGKKRCDFCGSETKGKTKDFNVKKYNMPFIVNLGNLKTFYSEHSAAYQMCSFCSYASIFAAADVFYNISGAQGVFFIPYDSDLKSLSRFYGVLDRIPRPESPFTNYKSFKMKADYLHENLLLFLYNIYAQSFKEMHYEQRLELLNKKIYGFIGNKQGNNVTFKDLTEFSRVAELFELFSVLRAADFGESEFTAFLRNFWEKDKKETILRERFATRLLKLEYLNDVVEEQMYTNFESLPYVGRFITTYNTEVDGMDEKMVSMCKRIGNVTGAQCRSANNKGALYSIRNSKNLNEFLRVLSQLQYQVDISFSETLFLEIDDDNWERYKSLISIFAMNSFNYRPQS